MTKCEWRIRHSTFMFIRHYSGLPGGSTSDSGRQPTDLTTQPVPGILETMETNRVSHGTDGLDLRVEARLREVARNRFLRFGFSRVTTDEISEDAGVSKKTLYRYFPTKEDLLRAVMRSTSEEIQTAIQAILLDSKLTFAVRMRRYMTQLSMRMSQFDPAVMADIQRNAPAVWNEFEEFRRQKIMETLGRVLRSGMARGMLRRDVDPDFVIAMYVGAVRNALSPEQLAGTAISHGQAFETMVKVFFEGLLTDRARSVRKAGHRRKVSKE